MSKPITVLYLSYTGLTDPLGQSQVLAYLEKLSLQKNYRFIVISFEKEQAYKSAFDVVQKICHGAGITWYPLKYTKKPPVVSTFRDVNSMKRKARQVIKQNNIGLVHCRSYIASLVGLYIRRRYKIPFIFDMRSFWADERVEGGIWKLSNPLYLFIFRYFKKKEKQFLKEADHVVSLTENGKREMLGWNLGLKPEDISVIPCCADFSFFDPGSVQNEELEAARKNLNVPGDAKIFTYLGTLGTWYMLDEMMDFAKLYMQKKPGYYFLIITGEPEAFAMQAATRAGINTDYIRVIKLPRKQVPVYLSLSTFSIFFIKPVYSKKSSSPVKQGELMAMGIPVVCNDGIGDSTSIVLESHSGIVLNEFNPDSYEQAIETFDDMVFDRQQIRASAQKYFLLSHGVESYASIYMKFISGNHT